MILYAPNRRGLSSHGRSHWFNPSTAYHENQGVTKSLRSPFFFCGGFAIFSVNFPLIWALAESWEESTEVQMNFSRPDVLVT